VLVATPAALLVLVATGQMALSGVAALTPWKGGGFGMFSTNDHAAHRTIRIIVTARDRSEEIAISPSLEDAASRAAMLPGRRELERLARLVVERERRHGRPAEAVRIECWRTEYDPTTLVATRRALCHFLFRVDPRDQTRP
jgi:hypothetical protein